MYEKEPLKFRIPEIKSLAMLKMEKNFIAHCEKGYTRQPYKDINQPIQFLIYRINQELVELKQGYIKSLTESTTLRLEDIVNLREECADMSNLIDYLYERLLQEEIKLLTDCSEKVE